MTDWTKVLRRASFRGAAFWVDFDDLSGGRRLVLHEFGGGEHTTKEDFGAVTRGFDVTAYVVGSDALDDAKTLTIALGLPGSGYLILPADGGMMASAETFRRSRAKDRMGYIAFDIHFVPDSNAAGTILTLGDLAAAFASGVASAATAFARLF